MKNQQLNKYSAEITQNTSNPAAKAMLYGVGLKEDDLKKYPPISIIINDIICSIFI